MSGKVQIDRQIKVRAGWIYYPHTTDSKTIGLRFVCIHVGKKNKLYFRHFIV